MKTSQSVVCAIAFLFQLQCCNAALKHRSARPSLAAAPSDNADLPEVTREMTSASDVLHGDPLAGRRKFAHLVALQEWQRVTRTGVSCPKPTACECHCDCPNTVATGFTPTSPPACVVWPSFPTPSPPPITTTGKPAITTTPSPKMPCEEGQVQLSDGTCKFIDMEIIKQLLKMVEVKRALLVEAQCDYNSVNKQKCCAKHYEVRGRLIDAHTQYRAALGMFVNALAAMKKMTSQTNVLAPPNTKLKGDEFVPGRKKLRPHCEHWTMNGTIAPDDDICAIICRNQPSCVGFARDPVSHWCLWFDDVKQKPGLPLESCSSETETAFVKKWQAPINNELWTTMEKIHVFDKAIVEALKLADYNADGSNKTLVDWWGFKGDNITVKLGLKDHFIDYIDNYTGAILDTTAMRKQYFILQKDALSMVADEVLVNPALDPPPPAMRAAKAQKINVIAGFKAPLEDAPKVLKWQDFPNSDDTAWSKIHPDCPMGVPCFCDCKCRGAPPQNFVEPPPPGPVMNPAMMSAILTGGPQMAR